MIFDCRRYRQLIGKLLVNALIAEVHFGHFGQRNLTGFPTNWQPETLASC
jgi:hypothetical protein